MARGTENIKESSTTIVLSILDNLKGIYVPQELKKCSMILLQKEVYEKTPHLVDNPIEKN